MMRIVIVIVDEKFFVHSVPMPNLVIRGRTAWKRKRKCKKAWLLKNDGMSYFSESDI